MKYRIIWAAAFVSASSVAATAQMHQQDLLTYFYNYQIAVECNKIGQGFSGEDLESATAKLKDVAQSSGIAKPMRDQMWNTTAQVIQLRRNTFIGNCQGVAERVKSEEHGLFAQEEEIEESPF